MRKVGRLLCVSRPGGAGVLERKLEERESIVLSPANCLRRRKRPFHTRPLEWPKSSRSLGRRKVRVDDAVAKRRRETRAREFKIRYIFRAIFRGIT